MQTYIVGGAIRDDLYGQASTDRDWVVTGASPESMIAAGFRPVGRDFPVFLHPVTNEEYALARTERKTAPGYHGFSFSTDPGVTLEDDLSRRDLTINAMARDASGTVIDPFGGRRDLAAKVLRHVSPAFAEDPVRILRLARFAGRFSDFTVAAETLELARRMVESGEVDALVPERIWQELSRGLMTKRPSRMFDVLRDCGALARLLPEVDRLWGAPQAAGFHSEVDAGVQLMRVLDAAAGLGAGLEVRFACMGHDLGQVTTPAGLLPDHASHARRGVALVRQLSQRLRVPLACREMAELVAREHANIHQCAMLSARGLGDLLERCDALRRPERFPDVLLACECDARGRLGQGDSPYPQRGLLMRALALARGVDSAAVAAAVSARGASGPAIGDAVRAARSKALETLTETWPPASPRN